MTESTSFLSRILPESLHRRLFGPVDSTILVWTRIVVGVGIVFWAKSYTKVVDYGDSQVPLYDPVFLEPKFLFKYAGFEWVRLWPGNGIAWHFLITKIAGVCLTIGFLTRLSAATLCAAVAYVLMVERQIYLNHYYLLSCIAGLLVFLPSGRSWSVDAWLGIERSQTTFPRWMFWLVQFQLGMPYFFGAIAKMNADWVGGQPAGLMLSERTHLGFVQEFVKLPFSTEIFAWGGLLFDLLVVPMLLYRRTRWIAVTFAIVFHVSNSQLFMIGVFPWFMLATLIVFFPECTAGNLRRWLASKYSDNPISFRQAVATGKELDDKLSSGEATVHHPRSVLAKAGFALAVSYVVIQLLLPVRPWVLPGNPSWNERGQRFAWRMMLRRKQTLTHYLVKSPDGDFQYFSSLSVMTPYQSSRAERNPELLRQAAIQFQTLAAADGYKDVEVYCLALVSLNGRRPVPLVDPTVDLTKVKRGWFSDDWVTQEVGKLPSPENVWSYPKEEWWKRLVLPEPFKRLQGRTPSELDAYVKAEYERQKAISAN